MTETDVLVVGAGAGGIGAALAAARHGARVILLERLDGVGGTAGPGGVCHWEAGIGGTGVPIDIYRKLHSMGDSAVAIYGLGRHICAPEPSLQAFPGGEHPICPNRRYAETLRRYGARLSAGYPYAFYKECCFGVCFTPEDYEAACLALLQEHGVELRLGTAVTAASVENGVIRGVRTSHGDDIQARYTIDATGTAAVAVLAGCRTRRGREGRDVFGEKNAPETSDGTLNAVSQMFRVAPREEARIDPLPEGIPPDCWWAKQFPVFSVVELPDGTWSWNQLPTMSGEETEALGQRAQTECRRRVLAGWHDVQTRYPEFRRFTVHSFSPELGVRDGVRVVCRYTLTQPDLEAGLAGEAARHRIAIADHLMDVHGEGHIGYPRLAGPYGIPFDSLLAADCENLLVASRGAGFSAVAASSARLTRTVMQLGQAAGTAAAMAVGDGVSITEVSIGDLQEKLRSDGVQLEQELTGEAERRADE